MTTFNDVFFKNFTKDYSLAPTYNRARICLKDNIFFSVIYWTEAYTDDSKEQYECAVIDLGIWTINSQSIQDLIEKKWLHKDEVIGYLTLDEVKELYKEIKKEFNL